MSALDNKLSELLSRLSQPEVPRKTRGPRPSQGPEAAQQVEQPLPLPSQGQAPSDPVSTGRRKKRNGRRRRGGAQPTAALAPVPQPPAVPALQPESQTAAVGTWAKVVGRKAKKNPSQKRPTAQAVPTPKPGLKKVVKPGRSPTTAAITVTVPARSETTYAAVMSAARERIKLKADCGIETVKIKKAVTGADILEVSGPDCAAKADVLAAKMREVLAADFPGVRIVRPVKMGEVRVMDLDDSVTPPDVVAAVAGAGGCEQDDVKTGVIRRSYSGLNTVWVRCPLSAVRKLAVAKRIPVGWVSARVEVLAARPLQCFRCLELGHVCGKCTTGADRSACCYACGEPGHRAAACTAEALKCPVCADYGLPADHRLGSKKCAPPKGKRVAKKAPPAPKPGGDRGPVPSTSAQAGEEMEASQCPN